MTESEVRKARNEAAFRTANEEIRRAQIDLGVDGGRLPFICECEAETCHTVVRLTPAEYEGVRSDATHFLVVTGHPSSTGSPVERHDGWFVVEKQGVAETIVRESDPRSSAR